MHYKMNGLRADNPQGWMAAVGVLYILDRMGSDVQMRWDNYHPVIHGLDKDQVIDTLENYLTKGSDILERLPVGIGNRKASLDITAGTVNLKKVITQMVARVNRGKIEQALDKQWINKDEITSLGWDIRTVKFAASIEGGKAPEALPHRGELAGQWLAAESLSITGTGLQKKDSYRWVTWSIPLDLGGARAVIQAISVDWGGACYAANVARNGQMGYLEPARTISSQAMSERFAIQL